MKNFTKQNFKTNPLWIRLLILALMMLVGTSSAWAAYYVAGSMNGWSTNNSEWELKNGSVTRWLNAGNYEWKITNGSWNQSWGNNGNNISTSVSCSGPVTFKFSGSDTPTASFNCPTKFNQSAITFYYDATNTPDVINSNKCYFMLGDDDGASRTTLSRVSGTQYLYKGSVSARNNNLGWYIFYESEGYAENIHKWCYSSHKSTCTYNSAAATNKVYKGKSTTESVLGENNTSVNRYAWENSQSTYTTYKVTINSVEGGTLTVKDYDNATVSNGTSKSILTVLKFSASASTGYELEKIEIKNSSGTVLKTITAANLTSTTYTLTSAVTIVPTWKKSCTAPSGVSITRAQTTKPCPGDQVILAASVEAGDVDTYNWSVSGTGWGIKSGGTTNSCTFTVGTETGKISLKVNGCNKDVFATEDIQVKSEASASNYTIKDVSKSYTGSNISFTASDITVSSGAGTISGVVLKQNGNSVTPKNVGTYNVYINTSANDTYCEGSDLYIGDFEITCPAPAEAPDFEVTQHEVNCGTTNLTKGTIKILNPVTGYKYRLGNDGNTEYTLDANNSITGIDGGTQYRVSAVRYCGNEKNSTTNTSKYAVVNKTDVKLTPTLSSTPIVKCGEGDNAYTPGTLVITNYNDNYDYSITPNVGEPTINGTNATYSINAQAATEYTVTATHKTYKSCSTPATITVALTDVTPTIGDISISGAGEFCMNSNATLTCNIEDATYQWYKGENPIEGQTSKTLSINVTETASYKVEVIKTSPCRVTRMSDAVRVTMLELPESPSIQEGTTVCPNTAFELPTIDGKWYAQAEGGSPYASNTITNGVAATTYYYAEAVKNGCSSARRTQYTVNVHTAPVAPAISLNPETVGQDKNSVLTISDATYSPSNTKYVLYKGSSEVGEMTSQTTNVSSSDVGSVKYTVKATHKECAALTSTSNEVTLTVQEAGAQIAALGDLKVDPQDPIDFVAMHVKNDGLSDYTEQGATKVTGYTWQISTDGGNTWKDCVSTATIGVTNGSDKCNNFRPSAVGKYRCKITYDKGEQTSNVLTVTGDGNTAKTFKGVTMNIPVISVNTGKDKFPTCDNLSGTASKNADVMKEKISVDVKIFNADGTVYYDRKARMNYRGSSSLNFVKKSYAFCTGKEKTKNDKGAVDTGKENLFGLSNGAKDKDWVLYAAAADPSIMRNRLMLDTYRDMTGGWGVNSMYVELVINGEYKGVYVLMDKITANMGDKDIEGDGRVEVEWKLDKQGNTTQEGFIVKFDKTDIADRYENTSGDQKTFMSTYSGHDGFDTYDTYIDQRFEIEYPEKEDIEEEDLDNNKGAGDWSVVFNSIKDKFIKFEKELKDGNFSEVQKIIDYTSWADWFIITEFGKNIDGYRASNLFVYDGSKPNAKIEARPLWDQELSFDNQCPNYYAKYGANSPSGFMVDKSNDEAYNNDASTPFWFTGRYKGGRGTYNGFDQTFKGLLDDPCFVAVVKARWEKHKADALSSTKLNAKITAYTNEIGAALNREKSMWKSEGGALSRETCQCSYSGSTGYVDIKIDDSKKAITEWIKNRPAGLSTAIEVLKGLDLTISLTVTPEGGETTPWEAVMVKVNNPSGYDYDFKYTTNNLNQVEGVIIQESNDKYTYRIPRPSAWGTGDGTRTAIEYGIEASLKVDGAGTQCGSEIDADLTKATTTITLKDEENDNCTELTD